MVILSNICMNFIFQKNLDQMFLAIILSKNEWLKYDLVKSRLFSTQEEKPGWFESLCIWFVHPAL